MIKKRFDASQMELIVSFLERHLPEIPTLLMRDRNGWVRSFRLTDLIRWDPNLHGGNIIPFRVNRHGYKLGCEILRRCGHFVEIPEGFDQLSHLEDEVLALEFLFAMLVRIYYDSLEFGQNTNAIILYEPYDRNELKRLMNQYQSRLQRYRHSHYTKGYLSKSARAIRYHRKRTYKRLSRYKRWS